MTDATAASPDPTRARTVLITGATDGIGLGAARRLAELGHRLVLHGRDETRVAAAREAVDAARSGAVLDTVLADLADTDDVDRLGEAVATLDVDVLVNNAGVFSAEEPVTDRGLDVRFVVNTLAPYRLALGALAAMPPTGRVVNLSSAAQTTVDLDALAGRTRLPDSAAYAQSKLALTMWTRHLADQVGPDAPVIVAVNPGSLLATKMVRDAYGIDGNDVAIGIDVLVRAAVGEEFADASGRYYDNDAGTFADPHADALDPTKNAALVAALDEMIG
ncbi:SDR family NAD(P)-dependent oxidoreductase [Nocardioides panacisoli]|uniref:SDR family NAD(P)-dependent oxidoreductase n=1 Tax=Nocardioides panacisoli TaxID=627624 RepID=UPI001C62FA5A|nr:SDR family NAD(P)-dependent oxidoreductase [Nocardioides panacisoli]QYJ03005.1 SDR family NAD(P)-dependent oxidoreductase [Nocardioides panacisoli]